MDSAPLTAYQPNPSVTPEEARDVRARVWRFAIDCYAKKKGGVPSTADDAKGRSESEFRARTIISK